MMKTTIYVMTDCNETVVKAYVDEDLARKSADEDGLWITTVDLIEEL